MSAVGNDFFFFCNPTLQTDGESHVVASFSTKKES